MKIIDESKLPQVMEEACHVCMLQLVPGKDKVSKPCQDKWGCLAISTEGIPIEVSHILKQFEDLF